MGKGTVSFWKEGLSLRSKSDKWSWVVVAAIAVAYAIVSYKIASQLALNEASDMFAHANAVA